MKPRTLQQENNINEKIKAVANIGFARERAKFFASTFLLNSKVGSSIELQC